MGWFTPVRGVTNAISPTQVRLRVKINQLLGCGIEAARSDPVLREGIPRNAGTGRIGARGERIVDDCRTAASQAVH